MKLRGPTTPFAGPRGGLLFDLDGTLAQTGHLAEPALGDYLEQVFASV